MLWFLLRSPSEKWRVIDVKHTQITLGDRRSRFTNDLDSSRTILIGGNRHEGFSSEPTEKQNLTMNREYPREQMGAPSSTTIFHRVLLTVKVEADCHSEEGTMIIAYYESLHYGSVDYWENLLEGMPDYRDCCSNYFCWARSLSGWIIMAANVYNISNITLCRDTIWTIGCLSLIILSWQFRILRFVEMLNCLFLMFPIVFRILFYFYYILNSNSKL